MSTVAASDCAVELAELVKSYGPVEAVRGIDLVVAPGETVALLGPNGAGKTTTIDMLLGLSRPDKGRVSIFGASPADAVRSGWVGGILQESSLPDQLKVRELVTLVASYYPHPLGVDEVLERTGTSELAERSTTKLSGGQAQRVRFAAALVGDPQLLVLDEPTAGIDVEGRREFWEAMRVIAEGGRRSFSPPTISKRQTPMPTGSCSSRGARSSLTVRQPRLRQRWGRARSERLCPVSTSPRWNHCLGF